MLSFSALMETLKGYQENIRTMTSSLNSLEQAVAHLDAIQDDQEKVLLFITPSIQSQTLTLFEKIVTMARDARVELHIWMVADPTFKDSVTGERVATLVASTGGSLVISNGPVNFPDPGSIIQGKGYHYTASYSSLIRTSGTQNISISILTKDPSQTTSDPFNFELLVEPIDADFISLPKELILIKHANGGLSPDSLPVEVALSFPDQHPREIRAVELWVNQTRLHVNSEPPYGSFVIDLTKLDDSTQIMLEARVIDILGLTGQSNPQTINLSWDETEINLASKKKVWSSLALALPIAALFLVGLMVKPWRVRKNPGAIQQQIDIQENRDTLANENVFATFSRMESNDTLSPKKPHEITNEITLIGKDPILAQWVVDDEALEPLHAELRILPNGVVRLTDFNTICGTWVNFEKVSARGVELKQGDLVKLGNQLYRFNPRQK